MRYIMHHLYCAECTNIAWISSFCGCRLLPSTLTFTSYLYYSNWG